MIQGINTPSQNITAMKKH